MTAPASRPFPDGFLFGAALTASGIETMSTAAWPLAKVAREPKISAAER